MKIDPWRSAAIVPVFVYAVASALWVFNGATAALLVAFFLTALALPLAAYMGRRALPFLPAGILAGTTGLLWLLNGTPPTGALGDVAAGVVLASPLAFLAAVWVTEDLPGTSVAMIIIGLTDAVGLTAATRSLGTGGNGNGSAALLNALGAVYSGQGSGIGLLLRGQVPTDLPMSQDPDAVFVLLGILAMVGLLLSLLKSPGAEWVQLGPETPRRRHPAGSFVPKPTPSPELAGILASATRPELPAFPAYSGLYPALAAAAAAAGFLAAAEYQPTHALLAVSIGVALVAAYLVWTGVTRRAPIRARGPDASPRAPPSKG